MGEGGKVGMWGLCGGDAKRIVDEFEPGLQILPGRNRPIPKSFTHPQKGEGETMRVKGSTGG